MKIFPIPKGLCHKCERRFIDQEPIERISMCFGLCRVCAIEALLRYARKEAAKIPGLEKELMDLIDQEMIKEQ